MGTPILLGLKPTLQPRLALVPPESPVTFSDVMRVTAAGCECVGAVQCGSSVED